LGIGESIFVTFFCFSVVFTLMTCIYFSLRLFAGLVRAIDAKTKKTDESVII